MVLGVGEAHVYGDAELGLGRVSLGTYRLVALRILGDFALYLQVAVARHLYELGVAGKLVLDFVVEHRPHRTPHIRTSDREVGNLYGLGLGVVDAGTVELVAHGACSHDRHHESESYYI